MKVKELKVLWREVEVWFNVFELGFLKKGQEVGDSVVQQKFQDIGDVRFMEYFLKVVVGIE